MRKAGHFRGTGGAGTLPGRSDRRCIPLIFAPGGRSHGTASVLRPRTRRNFHSAVAKTAHPFDNLLFCRGGSAQLRGLSGGLPLEVRLAGLRRRQRGGAGQDGGRCAGGPVRRPAFDGLLPDRRGGVLCPGQSPPVRPFGPFLLQHDHAPDPPCPLAAVSGISGQCLRKFDSGAVCGIFAHLFRDQHPHGRCFGKYSFAGASLEGGGR